MVRIPLIRRQQKPDSTQAENGKDSKGKDSNRQDVSRLGKDQPLKPAKARDGHKAALPASPPDRDQDGGQYVLGTDKKIPLPGKAPKQEVPLWQSAAPVEKTSITLTLPESPAVKQPAEAPFVAKVLVPEWRPEPAVLAEMPEAEADETTSVPLEPDEEKAEIQPVEAAAVVESPVPESPPEPPEVTQAPKAPVVESTTSRETFYDGRQPPQPSGGGIAQADGDALAILSAMPDHIFRVGRQGITPMVGNGNRAGAGAASHGTGDDKSTDGKTVADAEDKSKLPGKIVLEELARQGQQHTEKVLETRQSQTFEFEISDGKRKYYLEARLVPFHQSEALALVRDVTVQQNALVESRKELENHLKERNTELMRVNKMLKTEVDLREEQEEVLKKNFRRLESLLDETIGAITLIVEKKDPHVADHQRRVCLLACAIAQEMYSRNDQMRAVRMAAQLHDLGKIFIPAEILRKPGKLTDAEMSVVKTHPDTDYQILRRINFPISIADVVRQHHERLDGSGYPQGLKGDSILMEARIIAVADVIEGMIFERPYRVAPGLAAALKEISDNKGRLYDPAVADACLRLFAEKKFQFEGMPVQENPVSVGLAADHRDL